MFISHEERWGVYSGTDRARKYGEFDCEEDACLFADYVTALIQAIDLAEEAIGYVDPYFVEKWSLQVRLEKLHGAMEKCGDAGEGRK